MISLGSSEFDWTDSLSMENAISTHLMGQSGKHASNFVRGQVIEWLGQGSNLAEVKDILLKVLHPLPLTLPSYKLSTSF